MANYKGGPGGRPLKFKSVKELQKKIDSYFASCDPHPEKRIRYEWHENKEAITIKLPSGKTVTKEVTTTDYSRPPKEIMEWMITSQVDYTITDLALHLDTTRRTLIDYEQRDDKYFHTIKKAKQRIEAYWEKKLAFPNATGTIFNLKNNFEWRDKTEIGHGLEDDGFFDQTELTIKVVKANGGANTKREAADSVGTAGESPSS